MNTWFWNHNDPNSPLTYPPTLRTMVILKNHHIFFSLYEYAFHRDQDEVRIGHCLKVGLPPEASLPYPNPLEEAVETDVFHNLLQRTAAEPKVIGSKLIGVNACVFLGVYPHCTVPKTHNTTKNMSDRPTIHVIACLLRFSLHEFTDRRTCHEIDKRKKNEKKKLLTGRK